MKIILVRHGESAGNVRHEINAAQAGELRGGGAGLAGFTGPIHWNAGWALPDMFAPVEAFRLKPARCRSHRRVGFALHRGAR